jgi:hypothetical protein
MNVLNLLVKREYGGFQALIPTKSGKFTVSMVAGYGLYSHPRTDDVESVTEFTEVELAIFREDGQWASFDDVKPIFDIIGHGEYYDTSEDAENQNHLPSMSVFGYIPVSKVEDVINAL